MCIGETLSSLVAIWSWTVEFDYGWLDYNRRDGTAEWCRCRERKLSITPCDKGVGHFTTAVDTSDNGNSELSATSLDSQAHLLASSRSLAQLQRRLRGLRALDNRKARGDFLESWQGLACRSLLAVMDALGLLRACWPCAPCLQSSTEEDAVSICSDFLRPNGAPLFQALVEIVKMGQRSSRQWHQTRLDFCHGQEDLDAYSIAVLCLAEPVGEPSFRAT